MNYKTLISRTEARGHLEATDWRFIDCRFDLMKPEAGYAQYQSDHIPGAVYADLDKDLSSAIGPKTGRHPLPDVDALVARLGQWGVGQDTQVVVYDDNIGMFAARLWWLLRWLGHDKVAVLDGGYQAWKQADYPVTAQPGSPTPVHFQARPQAGWTLDSEEVLNSGKTGTLLLDARAPERYRGEVEPIDPVAGHIPGARNYPLTANIGDNGQFKDSDHIRAQLEEVIGDSKASQIVHYCGSGVSACHNILAMEYAGLHGSRLYPGSWSEWIRDPNRGVETG